MQEIQAGRGVKGPYGDHIHLDLRHVGEEAIDSRLPFVRLLGKTYAGVDPVHEPIPIRPVLHYMMGGVDTDIDGATQLPGLFAAGEAACNNMNGANRLGSNSLTECLVFGTRAGEQAVAFARGTDFGPEAALVAQVEEEGARVEALRGKQGAETLAGLRKELHDSMERGMGVYREQAAMAQTVRDVQQIKQRFAEVGLADRSKIFNTEILAALELRNMIDVAEASSIAGARRRESRGAHACRDFPRRNDGEYLHHSLVHHDPSGGEGRHSTKPVTLGIWQPEERKY